MWPTDTITRQQSPQTSTSLLVRNLTSKLKNAKGIFRHCMSTADAEIPKEQDCADFLMKRTKTPLGRQPGRWNDFAITLNEYLKATNIGSRTFAGMSRDKVRWLVTSFRNETTNERLVFFFKNIRTPEELLKLIKVINSEDGCLDQVRQHIDITLSAVPQAQETSRQTRAEAPRVSTRRVDGRRAPYCQEVSLYKPVLPSMPEEAPDNACTLVLRTSIVP